MVTLYFNGPCQLTLVTCQLTHIICQLTLITCHQHVIKVTNSHRMSQWE